MIDSTLEVAARERVVALLQGWGLTDKPAEYGDGIHGWRCEHPDRYGECDCFTNAVGDALKLLADLTPPFRSCEQAHAESCGCVLDDCEFTAGWKAAVSDPQRRNGE